MEDQNLTKVFRVHNSISSDNIPNTEMCLQTVTVTPLCFTDSCCSSDPTHVNDVWIQTERRPSLQPPFHSVFSEDHLKGQMQVLVRSWSFLLYLNMTFRYYSFAVDSFLGTSLLLSSACPVFSFLKTLHITLTYARVLALSSLGIFCNFPDAKSNFKLVRLCLHLL